MGGKGGSTRQRQRLELCSSRMLTLPSLLTSKGHPKGESAEPHLLPSGGSCPTDLLKACTPSGFRLPSLPAPLSSASVQSSFRLSPAVIPAIIPATLLQTTSCPALSLGSTAAEIPSESHPGWSNCPPPFSMAVSKRWGARETHAPSKVVILVTNLSKRRTPLRHVFLTLLSP